jgi:hypothetical protein
LGNDIQLDLLQSKVKYPIRYFRKYNITCRKHVPAERVLFHGKSLLSEYVLVAVNDAEAQGRSFLVDEVAEQSECEDDVPVKVVKKVSLYGIQDLDEIPRPCSLKNEGIKRMVVVGGLIKSYGDRTFRKIGR